MPIIEVFADVGCPFTHAGLRALKSQREARGRSDISLRVRPWPLELINQRPMDPQMLAAEITPLRAAVDPESFKGFDPDRFPKTTLPALALTEAAYERDLATGEAIAFAVREALFERGEDISQSAILAPIAATVGIEVPRVDDYQATIVASWEDGKARGVIGSPHFFVNGEGFFCPTLKIQHDDNGFDIEIDHTEVERFWGLVFAS